MQKTNSAMIAETLESLQSGLIDFLKPKLSLPDPDWKEVVEPSIHPAFLPILRRKIKEGAQPSLEILDLASLLKLITFNWKRYFDDHGHQAKNYFFETLDIRNKIAHQETQDLANDDVLRALDTLKRVAEVCGHQATAEIAAKYHKLIFVEMSKTMAGEGGKEPSEPDAGAQVEEDELKVDKIILDDLDQKLSQAFSGRVVRKDLVKKLKIGFNIPVYVLEYLLGKYCSTTNETEIIVGLEMVKSAIRERIVRGDETELVKARLQKTGSLKLIDLVSVKLDEKVQGGKFWAKLATAGLNMVHIDHETVYKHERLLTGGIWANIELIYNDSLAEGGAIRPFAIQRLSPIQVAKVDFEEYVQGRKSFTRDQWIDVLMRTMGYEPNHPDFTSRRKLLYLLRLIPMVEMNHNLIELGPRGTGKSYVYREISPFVILLSGGQGGVPDLFGWKSRRDKPGLVTKYDLVAFDEVAGPNFKNQGDKQMYKGYMEQGSFSRGDEKGTVSADAGIVFNGNFDSDVETTARISHLFTPLPDTIRNDMAFHDRWHCYLPGWELPKMQVDYFTSHLGFISDYISEIFHSTLRKRNYTDAYEENFVLGSHIEERDRRAVAKTISGLIKLIHPDGECTKDEMREYLVLALELRRRVKEQLKRMGGIEYSKVNFSYIDKETGQENFVTCKELGALQIIPDTPLEPGDIFTVGYDSTEGRYSLFRIQVQTNPGGHRFNVVGTTGKGIKESARMAYDYLKGNASKMGIDRDINTYDTNIQVISLMQAKDASDLGVAFFVGLVSALMGRPVAGGLVVLGNMSLHGVLSPVEGLGDKLRIAMDSGARRIILPSENKRDFVDLPAELLEKLMIDFYGDPTKAAYKAIAAPE